MYGLALLLLLPGPEDAGLADAQLEWLERTLAASTAQYLVVAGHYPIYSICEHGPTPDLVERVKPLLEQYKVCQVSPWPWVCQRCHR